jgi:hypothetical protein
MNSASAEQQRRKTGDRARAETPVTRITKPSSSFFAKLCNSFTYLYIVNVQVPPMMSLSSFLFFGGTGPCVCAL